MKLKKIIKDSYPIQVKGSKEIEITGLCSDSRTVAPGNLFVAKKGSSYDGTQFIPDAISAGAVAILTDLYDPSLKNITQLITDNVSDIEARLAADYYQYPGDSLFLVGITGTKGKTTTSYIVKHFLDLLDGPCGLIGTIEYIIGKNQYRTRLTTPDVITNHKMLREMVIQGCKSAVMEVSSHALEQKRVAHLHYDVAVFTNLGREHLDYHVTMEAYAAAKRKLFISLLEPCQKEQPCEPTAVVNQDDIYVGHILEGYKGKKITYAIQSPADLTASALSFDEHGTECLLTYAGRSLPFKFSLIGRHNVYNLLAAVGVGLAYGISFEAMSSMAPAILPIRGRLEPVPNPLGLNIYVDFAHTEDSLKAILETLRELTKGKIITVFGCGGNRDTQKRPRMAQVSEELSDVTIVTSDNPRHEPPQQIIKEIMTGFTNPDHVFVESDRKQAIEKAIAMAHSNDIILIAGKGHEDQQIYGHTVIPFDDRAVALEICKAKLKVEGGSLHV